MANGNDRRPPTMVQFQKMDESEQLGTVFQWITWLYDDTKILRSVHRWMKALVGVVTVGVMERLGLVESVVDALARIFGK